MPGFEPYVSKSDTTLISIFAGIVDAKNNWLFIMLILELSFTVAQSNRNGVAEHMSIRDVISELSLLIHKRAIADVGAESTTS